MVLPAEFESYTKTLMGNDLYENFVRAMHDEATAYIRLNHHKCPTARINVPAAEIPWYAHGYALKDRPAFTFDPFLHAGLYYVQESSSMFLAAALRQYVTQPVQMLDMCAAPGGKSTLARMVLPEGSTLMCNEPMRNRAQILTENVQKCGHAEVIVTNNYPADYRRSGLTFDVILCDVPCSGEGMFRKNANATEEWSIENVENCRRLQRDIVTDAWACLEEGGILIYSTCTFNTKENEENVAWICEELGATLLPIDTEADWDIAPSLLKKDAKSNAANSTSQTHCNNGQEANDSFPVYRFIPGYRYKDGKHYGEGLFMAVLRKNADGNTARQKEQKRKEGRQQGGKAVNIPTKWLQQADTFSYYTTNNEVWAIPQTLVPQYEKASKKLHILSAGVCLGEQKGKDLVPDHSLALSMHLNQHAFPKAELSYTDALNYLRKMAVRLPPDTPRGFVLVTYRDIPLGFEKNIGQRANNLYPNEWRIKSSHNPEKETNIIDISSHQSICNNI